MTPCLVVELISLSCFSSLLFEGVQIFPIIIFTLIKSEIVNNLKKDLLI